MTRLFRSKSCGVVGRNQFNPPTPNPVFQDVKKEDNDDEIEEEEEDEEEESESEDDESSNPVSTPFINPISKSGGAGNSRSRQNQNQFAILDMLMAALRKSLVTCSVERDDVSSLDISWPTEVRHVSHVTFDRFNGFLGLPTELEPEVPMRVPSAR